MKSQHFFGPRFGYFGVSTSWGRNFGIQYLLGENDSSFESSIRGLHMLSSESDLVYYCVVASLENIV
jgi:hypothetical protein